MTNLLSLSIGTVLAGDYRIEQVLGAGGFGVTYLARELDVDRYVTIKEYFPTDFASRNREGGVIPRSQADNEDYQWGLDRFIDEAKALGRFDHHNIVRLYRYFRANSTAYMVLRFEEGQSLKAWLKSLGRAPRQQELDRLVSPLLDALEVIHGADFLHRDIAPDNIIVRDDRTPVLIDFGSARGEIAAHTRTLSALIKPGYSPYEQYAETGKKQGPWTDIYAFAGTLYFTVTGKRPPDAPSRLLKDELQPAEHMAIGAFRKSFLHSIDRGLRLDMELRPQSIAQWRRDLLDDEQQASGEKSLGWFFKRSGARDRAVNPAAGASDNLPKRPLAEPAGPLAGSDSALAPAALEAAGKGAPAAPHSPTPGLPAPPTGLRNRLRFGWRSPTDQPPKPISSAPDDLQPAVRYPSKALLPVVQPSAAKPPRSPKPPGVFRKRARPRSIRRSWGLRWQPLLFKLLIGFGVASIAVSLQDQLSRLESRGTGSVSSSTSLVPFPAKDRTQSSVAQRQDRPQLLLHRFVAHSSAISAARFAGNGQKIVTTAGDSTLKVWDTQSRALIATLEMDDGPATALATRGNLALTGHSEGVIALWNIDEGVKQRSFKRNDAPIWSLAFTGDIDRFWAAGHDWTVALWEMRTPSHPLHVLEGHENSVQAVSYSPANALLASGGADKSVKLWDGANFNQIYTYKKLDDFVSSLAFSPDGRRLVAGLLDGNMRIVTTANRGLRRIKAHDAAIVAVTFFSNDRFVTAGKDGSMKFWSLKSRRPWAHIQGGHRGLSAMDVSSDAKHIISADVGGAVTIWRMPG